MSSVGHGDAATIADTLVDYGTTEWDPYEESIAETATIVDSVSVGAKEASDYKSLALVKENYYSYDVPSSSRPTLFKVIRGLGALPFRAINSAASLAQRMLAMCNADMQIRGAVLANAAVMRRRYSGSSRLAGHSRYMITDVPPKQRILREHIREISKRLHDTHATGQPADLRTYLELMHIICTIVRAPLNTYDESLLWRAWDLVLQEMRGTQADILADALCHSECESEDVGTILRHLALGRLSGWKKHHAIKNVDTVTALDVARTASFDSDTYAAFLATNERFFSLLSNIIRRRPWAVHEALDDHVHLVWFKYTTQAHPLMKNWEAESFSHSAPQTPEIKWNYFLDNVALSFSQYVTRFDPTLSPEARSFVQFVASGAPSGSLINEKPSESTSNDLTSLITHLSNVLMSVTDASETPAEDDRPKFHEFCDKPCCDVPPNFSTDSIFQLFRDQPGLGSAELAHPVLPILCLLIELVKVSQSALIELTSAKSGNAGMNSVFGCLRRLWTRQFLLPADFRWGSWSGSGMGPGRWVRKEQRTYAMRLATCLFVAQTTQAATQVKASQHRWESMDSLAATLTATPELQEWTWSVISTSFCFQAHFSKLISRALSAEVPLTKEQEKDKEIHYIYADVLGQVEYLVQYLSAHQNQPRLEMSQVVPVEKLALIFEDVPPEVPSEVLGSVLTTSTSSHEWNAAVTILESCSATNERHFCRTILFFTKQLLDGITPGFHRRVVQMLRRSETSLEARLFMPHPTDRFVMLLISAIERRPYVGIAIRNDLETKYAMLELIEKVENGEYENAFDPVDPATSGGTREEQMRWREKMCLQLRSKISLSH